MTEIKGSAKVASNMVERLRVAVEKNPDASYWEPFRGLIAVSKGNTHAVPVFDVVQFCITLDDRVFDMHYRRAPRDTQTGAANRHRDSRPGSHLQHPNIAGRSRYF